MRHAPVTRRGSPGRAVLLRPVLLGAAALLVLAIGGAGCSDSGAPIAAPSPARPSSAAEATPSPAAALERDYTVGTAQLLVTEPSGTTPARGPTPPHAGRSLPTSLWFPARADGRPIAGNFPLVAFAHGFDTTPAFYDRLLREVAARGYVVAAPLFPISGAGLPGPPREDDMFHQPADLTAVITRLEQLSAGQDGPWSRTVDPSRVAAMGHSDGAEGVASMLLYSGERDDRLRAAVVLSGRAFPPPVPVGSTVPVLVEQGLADTTSSPARGHGLYDQLDPPKAYLTEVGGSHTSGAVGTSAADGAVRMSVIAFLDVVLRNSPVAVLDRAATSPGLHLEVAGPIR